MKGKCCEHEPAHVLQIICKTTRKKKRVAEEKKTYWKNWEHSPDVTEEGEKGKSQENRVNPN